jgi:POTRA domain-containing FtsQ-type protein/cell division protein FtsQ
MPELGVLVPSGSSLLIGLALLVLAVGGYVAARETPVFAVRTIDVRGGNAGLRAQVRAALAAEAGQSLLKVDDAVVSRRVAGIPGISSFSYDRVFPHTLRVVVRREVPVLVVRVVPGKNAYLVGASGRVIRPLDHSRLSHLPRLWVRNDVQLTPGSPLPAGLDEAATTLGAARGASLPGGVTTVELGRDELTLVLGSGMQIRLGDDGDVRLKLAIARHILRATNAAQAGAAYLDVSVPERPVLSDNSQVGG